MNSSGKIKILALLILAILSLTLYTMPPSNTDVFFPSLSAFVTGFIGVLLISFLKTVISKKRYGLPSWNDKLFRNTNPLSNYIFASLFFIVIGLCSLIKSRIVFQGVNLMSIVSISFGVSILLATYLSYFLFKSSSGNIIGKWQREENLNAEKESSDTNYWASITFNSDTTFSIAANNEEKHLGVSLAEWFGGSDLKGKWRIEKKQLFLKSEGLSTNFFSSYDIIQLTSGKLILLSKGDTSKPITYSRKK
jgi:hypothetical protein